MVKQYSTADAFVFPTFSEGLAGVVLEAMTAVTYLTTNASGIQIDNYENAILLEVGSVKSITEACFNILEDRQLRNKLSNNSLKNALFYNEFNWESRLIKCFRQLC